MGANQSVDASHVRIWNNLCAIQNPATKAQMLETLLASPEYRNALKQMGVHSFCLQWLAGYNGGKIYQWPYAPVGQQTQQRPQQRPAMPASPASQGQGPQQGPPVRACHRLRPAGRAAAPGAQGHAGEPHLRARACARHGD